MSFSNVVDNATLNDLHNFEWALNELREGRSVRRDSWATKNDPTEQEAVGVGITGEPIHPDDWGKGLGKGRPKVLKLIRLTTNSMIVIGPWSPNWEDMNAIDWTNPVFEDDDD